MAWGRVYQTGFESGSQWEFERMAQRTVSISTSQPYSGLRSIRHSSSRGDIGWGFPAAQQVRGGYHLRKSANDGFIELVMIYSGSNGLVGGVQWRSGDGNLWLYDADGDIASIGRFEAGLGFKDDWDHIGFIINGGATGYFSLYINGVEVLASASPLQVGGVDIADFTAIHILDASFGGFDGDGQYDNFYIDTAGGAEAHEPVPSPQFLWQVPESNGGTVGWTSIGAASNWQAVSGVPLATGSFNYANANGTVDLYNTPAQTVPDQHVINAIIPTGFLRRGIAAYDMDARFLVDDGVNRDEGSIFESSFGWGLFWERFTTQADGVTAWDAAAYAAHTYGIEAIAGI